MVIAGGQLHLRIGARVEYEGKDGGWITIDARRRFLDAITRIAPEILRDLEARCDGFLDASQPGANEYAAATGLEPDPASGPDIRWIIDESGRAVWGLSPSQASPLAAGLDEWQHRWNLNDPWLRDTA